MGGGAAARPGRGGVAGGRGKGEEGANGEGFGVKEPEKKGICD